MLQKIRGKTQLGRVKVRFSAKALGTLFVESDVAFQITRGMPVGARLVDMVFDTDMGYEGGGWVVFEHTTFPLVPDGASIPEMTVEWQCLAPMIPAEKEAPASMVGERTEH